MSAITDRLDAAMAEAKGMNSRGTLKNSSSIMDRLDRAMETAKASSRSAHTKNGGAQTGSSAALPSLAVKTLKSPGTTARDHMALMLPTGAEEKEPPTALERIGSGVSRTFVPSGVDLAKSTLQMGMRDQVKLRQDLADANKELSAYNQRQRQLADWEEKYADDSDFMKGVKSIPATVEAAIPMAKDAVVGAVKDLANDGVNTAIRGTEEYQALAKEYSRLWQYKRALDPRAANYKERAAELDRQMAENEKARAAMMKRTAIDPNSTGMKMMREANWLRQEATEDLSGAGLFAANTALSIGQNAVLLPTAAINPAVPLIAMGTMSGAQKAYEVTEAGGYASDALARGIISGAIEAATEKLPLDTLADLVKTGGKGVVKNILKQAGVEAAEEGLSYTVNYIADKAAKDPNATFDVGELLQSAAAGGLSGLFFGVGGTAINKVSGGPKGLMTYEQAEAQRAKTQAKRGEAIPEAKGLPTGRETAQEQQKTASPVEAVKADTSRFDSGILSDLNKARSYFIEYAKAHFPSSVTNRETGKAIGISRKGLDKFLSGRIGREKYATGFHIPELVERAHKVASAENYHTEQTDAIPTYEYYNSAVTVDGKGYTAHIRVKNTMMGDKYYGHTISEVEDIKIEPSARTSASDEPTVQPVNAIDSPISDTTIPQAAQGVKEEYAQGGGKIPVKPEHMTNQEWQMWQDYQERKAGGQQAARWGTPATDKLGMEEVSSPITTLDAARSIRGLEKARYEAKRELNRLLKQAQLTPDAQRFARDIADGIYTVQQAAALGMDPKVMEEVADAYRVVNSFNEKAIQARKAQYTAAFDVRVQEVIKHSDRATPPSPLSLNANTMQRNNERTWGKDAAAINAEFFDPVIENEAKRIRFVNAQLSKLEPYHLTTDESAQVQKLVEKKITEADLYARGYDAERLSQAANTLTKTYADFYEAINDFLVAHGCKEIGWQKNYAPHMQEEQVGQLQKYLQSLGFQTQVTELPTDIAGRTENFKPGKQFDPYFQHRVGDKTVYDAVGGFESYVNYLSNVFYHTDDIQKLRRLDESLRRKYGPDELRAELDRLNHLQDQLVNADDDLRNQDIEAMKEEAFNRAGTMSKFGSYVSVLDDYTNILAGKQAKVDRAIESLFGRSALNFGRNIENAFSRAAILGNLSSAINQTVQIPQLVTELGPRITAQAVADVATGKTSAADFTKQSAFLTGKRGIKSISEKSISERVFDAAAKPFEIVDDFASRVVVRAKYLEQIAAGADHSTALKAADQYATRLVGSRMKGAKPVLFEQKNPISKLVTTFQLEVANGWEHIVHDLPSEIRTLAEKQGRGAAAKRTAELVIASQVVNFLANSIIKSITGREPVPFDGLGMMVNYLASGYGMTKEDLLASAADNVAEKVTGSRPLGTEWKPGKFDLPTGLETLGEEATEDIPFVGNVTTLLGITDGRLPLPQLWNSKLTKAAGNVGTAMNAETDEEKDTAWRQAISNAAAGGLDVAATWLPMGNQVKKTIQGTEALARGGVYSGSGENAALQYNVERTPANILRGVLFGKSALPETDAYWATNGRALSEAQTATYKSLKELGVSGQDAYDLIIQLRKTTKTEEQSQTLARLEVLQASGLSSEQKAAVYYGIIASDKEKSFIDRMSGTGSSRGALADALAELRQVKGSGEGQKDRQRIALAEMTYLTEKEKSALGQQVLGDGRWLDYSSVDKLTVSLMSETNRKKAGKALKAGIDAGTFLDVYEAQMDVSADIGLLGKPIKLSEDRNRKAAIDAAAPGLNSDQRKVLYELFDVDKQVWGALGLPR